MKKSKKIQGILQLPKLVHFNWSIRSYLSDEKFNRINKMYVILELTTQDNQGKNKKEVINLTLTEFKVKTKIIYYKL